MLLFQKKNTAFFLILKIMGEVLNEYYIWKLIMIQIPWAGVWVGYKMLSKKPSLIVFWSINTLYRQFHLMAWMKISSKE